VTAIAELFAWEALDSRGTPTVGCEVLLADDASGSAIVPSGASTGTYEAHELRDGGARYGGRGVRQAVANVNGEIRSAIIGVDSADQAALDASLRTLDGTANLSRLGANAVLAVSIATCRAAAVSAGLPLDRYVADGRPPLLPLPMVNIISGGAHAGWALDIQDLLVLPVGAGSFAVAIEWCSRVRAATATVASERGLGVSLVADEGGLGLALRSNREALDLLGLGIERSGLVSGEQIGIAIDVAASEFYGDDGLYELAVEGRRLDAGELVDELAAWAAVHPVLSYEDPLADDDWEGWKLATDQLGAALQVIGDDLFATNLARLERGIASGCANAILVKPNQIGTLSDGLAALRRAHEAGFATVLSGRSGDTEDAWLADLAVGWCAGQVKIGSTMRGERTAKWNRLLQLEARAGGDSLFAGRGALARGSALQ
jgi:enolase